MKFYGAPNMSVFEINRKPKDADNIYRRKRLLFRFDNNGEFITEDAELIKKLERKFRHDEASVNEEMVEYLEVTPTESKLRHCRKCDFACETQGELLRHYREQHPKGG